MLLKNGKNATDPLLPLPKKASKILVAGTHADNLGYQCGGWTINWQGFNGNNYTRGMFLFLFSFSFLFILLLLLLLLLLTLRKIVSHSYHKSIQLYNYIQLMSSILELI